MDRKQAIGLMLASFPASQSQGQLVALAYLATVEDCTDVSIRIAAKEYMTGAVPSHDGRFSPSTAQFSARVRMHDEIGTRAARVIANDPSKMQELSPEYQADMRERIKALPGLKKLGYSAGDADGDRDVA